MSYLGDFNTSATVLKEFNTFGTNGLAIAMSGTPTAVVVKLATLATSVAGVTLTTNGASLMGLNVVTVDTSASGAFYSAGNDFAVVVKTGTVDGNSVVGTSLGAFSIRNRSSVDIYSIAGNRNAAVVEAGYWSLGAVGVTGSAGTNGTSFLPTPNSTSNDDGAQPGYMLIYEGQGRTLTGIHSFAPPMSSAIEGGNPFVIAPGAFPLLNAEGKADVSVGDFQDPALVQLVNQDTGVGTALPGSVAGLAQASVLEVLGTPAGASIAADIADVSGEQVTVATQIASILKVVQAQD